MLKIISDNMCDIILPKLFETDRNNKTKKKNQLENNSEIDICDNNDITYDNIRQNNINGIPIYDGIEPYYKFKRRWDLYIYEKNKKGKNAEILNFLNKLFKTEYKNLMEINKITYDMIPNSKTLYNVMSNNPELIKSFKLKNKRIISVVKLINIILNKINFSFIEIDDGKEIYFAVKPFKRKIYLEQ